MTRRASALAAAIAALVLLGCGQASSQQAEIGYLAAGAIPDAIHILPPPPKAGSPSQAADDAAFASTRALKGSPRWSLATDDAVASPQAAIKDFSCALRVQLDPAALPALQHLFVRVGLDGRGVIDAPKDLYARRRPFLDHPGEICIDRSDYLIQSASYPSGHATMGWTWALILAELAPDRSTPILMRGRAYGESRVVCGVHYPSDIEAGRSNGAVLVAALHGAPAFRADLEKARAELQAVRDARGPAPDPARCKVEAEAGAHQPW